MALIKLVILFFAYISLVGWSILDEYANLNIFSIMFPNWFAWIYILSAGYLLSVLSFKSKKSTFEKGIYVSLFIISLSCSVVNVFVVQHVNDESRFNNDERLMQYRTEKKYYQIKQDSLLSTYNECVGLKLNDGARGWRIEAEALTPRIDELSEKIKHRETYLDSVGNVVNESFSKFGGTNIGFFISVIFNVYLGALAPFAIAGTGEMIKNLSPGTDVSYLKNVQIRFFFSKKTFSEQLVNDYQTLSVYLPNFYKSKEILSLLGIIAIKSLLGGNSVVNSDKSYIEVGKRAGELLGRPEGAFSKSYVCHVNNGRFDDKLLKNRKIIKKLEKTVQELNKKRDRYEV